MVSHVNAACTRTPDSLSVSNTVLATGPYSSSTEFKYKHVTYIEKNLKKLKILC